MYYVSKQIKIAACHHLTLPYESKCAAVHGHNWTVTVYCKAHTLNAAGMVVDFGKIKELVHGYLDHGDLNALLPFNPTAENIAKWVTDTVPECYKCAVQESEGNVAIYTLED